MVRWRRLAGLAVLAAIPLWVAVAQTGKKESKEKPGPEQAKAEVQRDPALYAGWETCQGCHTEIAQGFETNPHQKTTLDTGRGAGWQGCEACHGPGKAHVEAGGDPTLMFDFQEAAAGDSSERCLACHEFAAEHSNFQRSAHALNDVGCLDCHSIHKPKVREQLLSNSQPQLCYTCHLETRTEFTRPFRHRVNEGLVECSDCHNPHGGFMTRQLRSTAAQDAGCFQCHTEKAGPFVFEHAPVKTEGCVSCHSPHGSSNPRLLKRSQVNVLCLECHTFTVDSPAPGIPAFHNQAQKYQACTMCHTAIHGSNFSDVFFR